MIVVQNGAHVSTRQQINADGLLVVTFGFLSIKNNPPDLASPLANTEAAPPLPLLCRVDPLGANMAR